MNVVTRVISVIVVIILAVCLAYVYFGTSASKITDYGRVCGQENVAAQDCKSWNLFATTYILDNTSETATWYDGSGDAQRTNCHIADKDNWWCDAYERTALQGNGQNMIGFSGGKSIENTPTYPATSTQHFGVTKYWWYKLL